MRELARTAVPRIELIGLPAIPIVVPGMDLVATLADGLAGAGVMPKDGDVFVVAQKIVSKAEGRFVELATISPSPEARRIAEKVDKDPRLVEIILSESTNVVRAERNVLIVRHRLGFVMVNGGVDQSNVAPESEQQALLLPADPDRSAETLREGLEKRFRARFAVIINDSFGRPWRHGTVGVAIGVAGLTSLVDKRGCSDLFGRTLKVTIVTHADEIAAAASLVMGQANEGYPAVLIRGLQATAPAMPASELVRPADLDLFP